MTKPIDNYMSPSEAAHRWGLPAETVKNRLKAPFYKKQVEELIESGLIKSFRAPGGQRKEWIISKEAMEFWGFKK